MKKVIVAFGAALLGLLLVGWTHGNSGVSSGWHTLKIGAGGLVSGIDINLDAGGLTSTKLARTDVGGCYKYNNSTLVWDPLITTTRMPAASVLPSSGWFLQGCYELVSAPSDTTTIYLAYQASGTGLGHLYKSTNSGATFTELSGWTARAWDANNSTYKTYGKKMAVDPANKNIVYIGTPSNGAFVTTDGGATYCAVPNMTASGSTIPSLFAFDPNSSTASTTLCGQTLTATQGIYASSEGNGIWHSTNGGTSFTQTTGGPTNTRHIVVSSGGVAYAASEDTTKAWRYTGTWTDITPLSGGPSPDCLAVSPFAAGTLYVQNTSGTQYVSTNANTGTPTWGGGSGSPSKTSPQIPWMAVNEPFMGCGNIQMDPITNGLIWFAEGIGVWQSTGQTAGDPNWVSISKGIEELSGLGVSASITGALVALNWDRSVFQITNPEVYPSSYGPNYTQQIEFGWAVDWASNDGTALSLIDIVAGGTNYSSYSTNSGSSWTAYGVQPGFSTSTYTGGDVASSTKDNIVMSPANDGDVYYSKNATNVTPTWTRIDAAVWGNGMQNAGAGVTTGWPHAYYAPAPQFCANRTVANAFYAYNTQTSILGGGLYKSVDSGDTWTRKVSGAIASGGLNDRIRCVPSLSGSVSTSGHVFYTPGHGGSGLWRCIDSSPTTSGGTITCTKITRVGQVISEVYAVDAGAVKGGNDYPSVYIYGVVNGTLSVFRSDDTSTSWTNNTVSWTDVGPFPDLNSTDLVQWIEADKLTWNKLYASFSASGHAYHQP